MTDDRGLFNGDTSALILSANQGEECLYLCVSGFQNAGIITISFSDTF